MSNAKPTYASVTSVRCSCGYLERSEQHPILPIRFDELENCYVVASQAADGTIVKVIVYHCPFCGGVPERSAQNSTIGSTSEAELHRLSSLLQEITTEQDIERMLGDADIDLPINLDEAGQAMRAFFSGELKPVRSLMFTSLSSEADVLITVLAGGTLKKTVASKRSPKS